MKMNAKIWNFPKRGEVHNISSIPLPKCIGQSRQPRQKIYHCLYSNGTKKESMLVCTPVEIPCGSPEQLIH
jgi:hypothetical protein